MINININFDNLQKQLIHKHNLIKKKIMMIFIETHHHNAMFPI